MRLHHSLEHGGEAALGAGDADTALIGDHLDEGDDVRGRDPGQHLKRHTQGHRTVHHQPITPTTIELFPKERHVLLVYKVKQVVVTMPLSGSFDTRGVGLLHVVSPSTVRHTSALVVPAAAAGLLNVVATSAVRHNSSLVTPAAAAGP